MNRLVLLSVALLITVAACSNSSGSQASRVIPPEMQSNRAHSMFQVSSAPFSMTGRISSIRTSTVFVLDPSSCPTSQAPYVYVDYSSSTQIVTNGLSLTPGVYAAVAGTGSCLTWTINATQIHLASTNPTPIPSTSPSPSPLPQTHIPTWAYDLTGGQGGSASSTQVRQYLTYAEGGPGDSKAVSDCHAAAPECLAVAYANPNHKFKGDSGDAEWFSSAQEGWFVHASPPPDTGQRLDTPYLSYTEYWADISNPSDVAWEVAVDQSSLSAFDVLFEDSTFSTTLGALDGAANCGESPCTTSQEFMTNAQVVAAHETLFSALKRANGTPWGIVFNGLGNNVYDPEDWPYFGYLPNIIGATCEACILDDRTGGTNSSVQIARWSYDLDMMARVAAMPGSSINWLAYGHQTPGSAANIQERTTYIGMVWLGFSPGHTIAWENLELNTDGLAAWPEEEIYPTQPVESMSSSHLDIQVATNVWRREFAQCFDAGTYVGPCASIVNGTASAAIVSSTWLKQSYSHQFTIVGGDAASGGSLSEAAFQAGSSTVPAYGAVLLRQ
jgi:hypothetical protein